MKITREWGMPSKWTFECKPIAALLERYEVGLGWIDPFCGKTRKLTPKAVERFIELGLTAAPIVETDLKRWSGFRLDKIKSLEQHLRTERAHGINVPLQPIKQVAEEIEDD